MREWKWGSSKVHKSSTSTSGQNNRSCKLPKGRGVGKWRGCTKWGFSGGSMGGLQMRPPAGDGDAQLHLAGGATTARLANAAWWSGHVWTSLWLPLSHSKILALQAHKDMVYILYI